MGLLIRVIVAAFLLCGSASAALVPAIEVLPATTVEVGEEVYFSATGTTYDDAVLLGKARYEWTWGDGSEPYSYRTGVPGTAYYSLMQGGIAATHYFMSPGTYTVTLSVKIWSEYTAVNGIPQVTSTSTSSVAMVAGASGDKTFTVETGKTFAAGMVGKIMVTASTGKYFYGTVKSYNSETGELVMATTTATSTGTFDAWTVSFDTLPTASETTTQEITVTGTALLSGFEIQRANYNNRTKQYLYIQIPAAHRNTTTQLKLSLIGDVAGTTVLNTWTGNLAAEEVYLFDQTSLDADTYVMQAQLLDSEGSQITGGIWRDKWVKGHDGSPTVGINENNAFVVGGELVFPVGPFILDQSKMPTYKSLASINALFGEGYYTTHDTDSWGTYLDAAAVQSLYAIGPYRGDYAITFAPSAGNSWKRNHDIDRMAEYVTANKSKSALFAWTWQDEVNLGGTTEKIFLPTVGAWAYKTKINDPNHPTWTGYVGSDWSRYYGTAVTLFDYLGSAFQFGGKKWIPDTIGYDTYPVTQQLYPIQNYNGVTGGTYSVALDSIDRFVSNNKNLIPMMWAIQPCGGLTPLIATDAEIYMEAWLNVIHGAKGVTWFNYFQMDTTGRWTAMKNFTDRAVALKDVILAAPPDRTVTDTANPLNVHNATYNQNRVDTMIREYGGYIYVIAARVTEPDPANSYVTVTLTGTPGTVVTDGIISDEADAHQWTLASPVTIGADGTVKAIATCVDEGYIAATPATLTKIVTPVDGWASVTHTQNATPGSRFQGVEPETLEGIEFTVSNLSGAATVEVLYESRNLSATDGVFSDDFAKNAVHIYKISAGTPTYHTITVTKAGAGTGTVTSSPSGINCGADCTEDVIQGNTVTLTATPDTASSFTGWSGTYGCTGTDTCVVSAIAEDAAVTATFAVKETPPTYYNMTVSYTGSGSGTTDPAEGIHSKGEGTEVAISATASTNSTFNAWSGTCGCTGSDSPCTIATFPGNDCTVLAEFTLNTSYTVSVTVTGGADYVTSETGESCSRELSPCQFTAFAASALTWNVMPLSGGYGCTLTGCDDGYTCNMTENRSITASCLMYGATTGGSGAMAIGAGGTITLGE